MLVTHFDFALKFGLKLNIKTTKLMTTGRTMVLELAMKILNRCYNFYLLGSTINSKEASSQKIHRRLALNTADMMYLYL